MLELGTSEAGVQFRVKVIPGASRSRIVGEMDGALKVAVAAPPEKGKANQAVLTLLAEALGVKRADLHIETGVTGRYKRCLVSGVGVEQVRQALEQAAKAPKE